MVKLARWLTTHRKYVLLGWVALLVVVNMFAQSAGTSYSNNFTLPNSDAQRASDLLERSFPAQAGDRDTIVYKVSSGTVLDPAVRARMSAMFARVAKLPHVAAVISPYEGSASGRSISADGRIAFATVVFDEKANDLPKQAAERVVTTARAADRPGLQIELGGSGDRGDRADRLRPVDRRRPARGDRRAAADVRLADRDGPADRHRAVRPRHRPRR